MRAVEAKYEDGLLKPTAPLGLRSGERVGVIVVRLPDPKRWNLERLSELGRQEDPVLSEAGLGDWANGLDEEDRH